MQRSVFLKLSAMMFLQYFIWGAWFPPSFGFFGAGALGFDEWQQFGLTAAFPMSAIIAMFFGNQFVDRNFAAERFLAFSHLVGGLALIGFGALSWKAFSAEGQSVGSYWLYFACMATHCFFYVPTISVTNSIAFSSMSDPQKDFGPVRLWGTIGWIAASWPFIFILADWAKIPQFGSVGFTDWLGAALGTPLTGTALNQGKSWAFLTGGVASILLAVLSLTLPHTPPKPMHDEKHSLAWLEAMRLLKHPFLLVLFVVTFIDATVHDGFFIFAFTYLEKVGVAPNWIQPAMSVGQIAEIGTMAILGYVLKNLGWRTTMILGILGHTVRFAVFAFIPNPYVAVAVNILHGICYAFFFATLYILVDEVFPKDARTSAQGLFNFLVLGMGPIVSRYLWPAIQARYTHDGVIEYRTLLLYPAAGGLIAAILLLLFFHPPKGKVAEEAPVTT
ncbi:MFS transporter [Schlesneria paludicola]|uniref:MFS transporter n=1 Tax=Schlesneria paludicola TaxID=360056 RepID=UPI000299E3C0|nr:MFS transporter [Schlesneria paludicola]